MPLWFLLMVYHCVYYMVFPLARLCHCLFYPSWCCYLPFVVETLFIQFQLPFQRNYFICSVQFSSVTQSCPTLCDPVNHSTRGLPVHHKLPELTQTYAHRVGDVIQPSHPLASPSPPAPNPSQHQGLFQRVNSSHEVAEVLEFQLQHQSLNVY